MSERLQPTLIIPGQEIRSTGSLITDSKPKPAYIALRTPKGTEYALRARDITASDFLEDNKSALAQSKIQEWMDNYGNGKCYLIVTCSDKRPIHDPNYAWFQKSVASGSSERDEYAHTYTNERISAIVVGTHFGNFELGNRPTGCGGQDAKANLNSNGQVAEEDDIEHFLRNIDKDPIYNGIDQARKIINEILKLKKSGRVFVTTQDHHNGKLIPVAEYAIENGVQKRLIPVEYVALVQARVEELEELYDPAEIYKNGIPHLNDSDLSSEFKKFLEIQNRYRQSILAQNPNMSEQQETQNPDIVVITDKKIPVEIRYPSLFKGLRKPFGIDTARLKTDDDRTSISQKSIKSIVSQAQYALEHAVKNSKDQTASFSRTKTLFIETGNINESRKIADAITQKRWAKEWLTLGGKIIIAQSRSGDLLKAEDYLPQTS